MRPRVESGEYGVTADSWLVWMAEFPQGTSAICQAEMAIARLAEFGKMFFALFLYIRSFMRPI